VEPIRLRLALSGMGLGRAFNKRFLWRENMSFTDIFAAIQNGTAEDVNAKTENNGLTSLVLCVQYFTSIGGV
jgi:hypothetical protein